MNELSPEEPVPDPDMQRAGHLILEGRLQEAETVLQQVIARRPEDPDPHYTLGVIYQNSQRLPEAITKLSHALELDPEFAEAYCNLGVILSTEGKKAEALAAFKRAIEIDPELFDAHSKLGDLLMTQGLRRDAIVSFRRAAAVAADRPIGLLAEARALEAEARLTEAEALLRKLLATAPKRQTGAALSLLGSVLAQLGRFEEAVAAYDETIATSPDVADACVAYFGRVNAAKLTEADRPLVDRMIALVDKGIPDNLRMTMHLALGKAFDDIGDCAAAIRQYDAANAIRQRDGRLNQPGLAAWVDRLRAWCTPEFFARTARVAEAGQVPIFILGMPRSGTTLLEQILSSHPAVAAGGELSFWGQHGPAWSRAGPDGFSPERTASLAGEYATILAGIDPDALRVIDKNPWNFQWIGMIRQALPNARFIHSQRHPVDTCLSIYFTHFTMPQPYMSDRSDLAFYYRQYARLMEHWRRVLPTDRYTEVDYATLVGNREAEARRLIAFCGLEWDDACLSHETNARPVQTASVWQARQPVYRSSLERWRRYEPWLGELRQLLPPSGDASELATRV
jgi:tetratricopeptide (TPR) repeat protein